MPRRKPAYRRVTPLASRRETQRRAAVALLAFIVVIGGLGLGIWAFASPGQTTDAISSINAGQLALESARTNLDKVTGPGIDLIESEPEQALELLTAAYEDLRKARLSGVRASTVEPLRARTIEGLDRLYGVVPVQPTNRFTFTPGEDAGPIDLRAIVLGPDGATFVHDASTKTIWRVDLKEGKASRALRAGQKVRGGTVSTPKKAPYPPLAQSARFWFLQPSSQARGCSHPPGCSCGEPGNRKRGTRMPPLWGLQVPVLIR